MLKALVVGLAILPGIYINDVDVGGMNATEAQAVLEAAFCVGTQRVVVSVGDAEYTHGFADFGAGWNFDKAVDEAIAASDGSFWARRGAKRALRKKPLKIYADFSYNHNLIKEIASKIAEKSAKEPAEGSYTLRNGQFVIMEGACGVRVDADALVGGIEGVLAMHHGGTVDAQIIKVCPKFSKADFNKATSLIGSFATSFDASYGPRAANIALGSKRLDNQMLMPGGVLSVCAALGPRTVAGGYVEAGQILHGQPDRGVGGGICQLSSTLYMAALYAELDIVQRQAHSLQVSYMTPATDATIAEGLIDLKIKNNSEYPMLIQSTLSNNQHKINIFGYKGRQAGRSIRFESVLVETKPHQVEHVECASLPMGYAQIVVHGTDGAKYELYKIITCAGGHEQKIKINTSIYKPLNAVIKIGIEN